MRIAIIGAGIGGLAATTLLGRQGAEITLFEQAQTLGPKGAGLLLQPTGLGVLAELGLLEKIYSESAVIHRLLGINVKTGGIILDLQYARLGYPHITGLGTHRGRLFAALLTKAAPYLKTLVTDCKITRASDLQASTIHLYDQNDQTYGPFDLVIDASGSYSTLQRQYAQIICNKPYPFGAIWGIAQLPANSLTSDTLWQQYHTAREMIGLLPIGKPQADGTTEIAFFWSMPPAAYPIWQQTHLSAWHQQVAKRWPLAGEIMQQFTQHHQLTYARYNHAALKRYYHGRLVWLGDAAHGTSPQLGQGANMALLDVSALVQALQQQSDMAKAIQQYDQQRRGSSQYYQLLSHLLTPFFQSHNPVLPWLRDQCLGPLCQLPFTAQQITLILAGMKKGAWGLLPIDLAHLSKQIAALQ